MGLSLESIEEVEFNADVFDTTRAELIDTCLHSSFFTRGESGDLSSQPTEGGDSS